MKKQSRQLQLHRFPLKKKTFLFLHRPQKTAISPPLCLLYFLCFFFLLCPPRGHNCAMEEDAAVDWIPLWKHRMSKITDILAEHGVESVRTLFQLSCSQKPLESSKTHPSSPVNEKKVLDIGCGEAKMLQCLRHNPKIKSLVGVDPDIPSLTKAVPAIQPLLTDMLQPRLNPLKIELYKGKWEDERILTRGLDSLSFCDPRFLQALWTPLICDSLDLMRQY